MLIANRMMIVGEIKIQAIIRSDKPFAAFAVIAGLIFGAWTGVLGIMRPLGGGDMRSRDMSFRLRASIKRLAYLSFNIYLRLQTLPSSL